MITVEHTAVLGSPGRDRGLPAALEHVLRELGFAPGGQPPTTNRSPRTRDSGELDLMYVSAERGAWVVLGTVPAMARAIAARVAARLHVPIQLFTATARYDDNSLSCTVEDRLLQPGGRSAAGTFARELEDSVGGDWYELCDSKPYCIMTSLVDAALDTWVPTARTRRAEVWSPPPSLGDRRLDELALRIRLAIRAELTAIDGRPCVRVTTAEGASTTSFLTPEELARLEPAVAGLVARPGVG